MRVGGLLTCPFRNPSMFMLKKKKKVAAFLSPTPKAHVTIDSQEAQQHLFCK